MARLNGRTEFPFGQRRLCSYESVRSQHDTCLGWAVSVIREFVHRRHSAFAGPGFCINRRGIPRRFSDSRRSAALWRSAKSQKGIGACRHDNGNALFRNRRQFNNGRQDSRGCDCLTKGTISTVMRLLFLRNLSRSVRGWSARSRMMSTAAGSDTSSIRTLCGGNDR